MSFLFFTSLKAKYERGPIKGKIIIAVLNKTIKAFDYLFPLPSVKSLAAAAIARGHCTVNTARIMAIIVILSIADPDVLKGGICFKRTTLALLYLNTIQLLIIYYKEVQSQPFAPSLKERRVLR